MQSCEEGDGFGIEEAEGYESIVGRRHLHTGHDGISVHGYID